MKILKIFLERVETLPIIIRDLQTALSDHKKINEKNFFVKKWIFPEPLLRIADSRNIFGFNSPVVIFSVTMKIVTLQQFLGDTDKFWWQSSSVTPSATSVLSHGESQKRKKLKVRGRMTKFSIANQEPDFFMDLR